MRKSLCFILLALVLLIPSMASTQPSAPTLSVTTNGLDVTMSWTSVPDASGYHLVYVQLPYLEPSDISQVDVGNVTSGAMTLCCGSFFAIAVKAYNDL